MTGASRLKWTMTTTTPTHHQYVVNQLDLATTTTYPFCDIPNGYLSIIAENEEQTMSIPHKAQKVRVQLDLTPSQAARYDALVEQCELGSRKELFNVAMSLFNWAVTEVRDGRKVASYDPKEDHVETVLIPALEVLSDQSKKRSAKHTDSEARTFEVVRPSRGVASVTG